MLCGKTHSQTQGEGGALRCMHDANNIISMFKKFQAWFSAGIQCTVHVSGFHDSRTKASITLFHNVHVSHLMNDIEIITSN